ncbi:MAG: outer membrane protein assembly factor BamA [Acidobacteriota bacterium]
MNRIVRPFVLAGLACLAWAPAAGARVAAAPASMTEAPRPQAATLPEPALASQADALPAAQIDPCSANETSTNLPPAGAAPVYRCVQFIFHPHNDPVAETSPLVDPATYPYHLKAAWSQRSQNRWVPYDESAIIGDFMNLWRTNFLEDLWIEVIDEPYSNGVVGKHVVFHAEERARIKVVDYLPASGKLQVDISKIESTLRERAIEVRLDSFVDESTIRQVKGVIRELYAEKGYNNAVINTEATEMPGGPKLMHLTFRIDQGPEVEIREIAFDGNEAFDDDKLRDQMKDTKQKSWSSALSGDGKYQESKFQDDAERVGEYYRQHGYAQIQIGSPQTEVIETSQDGKKQFIRLRIPVEEGIKYRVGKFELTGVTTLKPEGVRALYKIAEGDVYNIEKIRKGFEKTKEVYGTYGFWQLGWEPELSPEGIDPATGKPIGPDAPPPIMDVNIKINEGKQFFINRITFAGNTTTHDAVIRRELRVSEGGVFNSEALKESVRRLNQLGYFKALEGKEGEMDVTSTPDAENKVDVRIKVEEQNRNTLSFGAGVSQYDGVYGQLSFQTANFLGRGETLGVSLQRGSQAQQYQLSFSEPYLFDRAVTVGASLYSREFVYPLQYTQGSTGGNTTFGLPLADYTRLYLGYSYETVTVSDINEAYLTPQALDSSPYLRDALLIDLGGRRKVGKISPSVIFNTVNQPIFPSQGARYTGSFDLAGIGGNTEYTRVSLEGIWFHPLTARTSFGLRGQAEYIRPYGSTLTLPIFEKLSLGGEYSIRGYDLRTVAPRDSATGVLTGGNKTLLFNAEYYVNVFGQARIVGFYDVGQVRDLGQRFGMKEPVLTFIAPETPFLSDPLSPVNFLTAPGAIHTEVIGQTSAFKTSTGMEVRFFIPVLNVPFRLIMAYNPQRFGVINNNSIQTPRYTFRFAVGTTF